MYLEFKRGDKTLVITYNDASLYFNIKGKDFDRSIIFSEDKDLAAKKIAEYLG